MNSLSLYLRRELNHSVLPGRFIDFWQNTTSCFKGKETHRLRRLVGHQRAIREQHPDELIANAARAAGAHVPRNIWAHTSRARVPGTRSAWGFAEPNMIAKQLKMWLLFLLTFH